MRASGRENRRSRGVNDDGELQEGIVSTLSVANTRYRDKRARTNRESTILFVKLILLTLPRRSRSVPIVCQLGDIVVCPTNQLVLGASSFSPSPPLPFERSLQSLSSRSSSTLTSSSLSVSPPPAVTPASANVFCGRIVCRSLRLAHGEELQAGEKHRGELARCLGPTSSNV